MTSFTDYSLAAFERDSGIALPADLKSDKKVAAAFILANHYDDWIEWKCRSIADFVREVGDAIRAEKPGITLGIMGIPWRRDEEIDGHPDAIRAIMGQDFALLSEKGGVDIFSPMTYHLLCYRDVPWIAETAKHVSELTDKPVIPLIQACSEPLEVGEFTDVEFGEAITAALAPPSEGVVIFHANHIENENKWEAMRAAVEAARK